MTVFELHFLASAFAGGIFVVTITNGFFIQLTLFSLGLGVLAFAPNLYFPTIDTNSMVLTYVLSWCAFYFSGIAFRKIIL